MDASPLWPWLEPAQQRWRLALDSKRVPHAVLLAGPAGVGKRRLAEWIAATSLCEAPAQNGPCGRCGNCMLLQAGNHPDLLVCTIEEDATSIKVEQIRALSEALSMKSYRGGRKVAILDPADSMTVSSFNALLKTLEEPSEDSLLLLTVSRPERVPVTIASRCQKLPVLCPRRDQASAWLNQQQARSDWALLLDLASGVPARALALAAAGGDRLYAEIEQTLIDGVKDVAAQGDVWAKDRPVERLRCLEQCLNGIARQAYTGEPVNNSRRGALPSSGRLPDIGVVVRLLDAVRETRSRLDGPANAQLLFETLLVRLRQGFG